MHVWKEKKDLLMFVLKSKGGGGGSMVLNLDK